MGKCSVCGNKIMYNAFKRIKGIIYCLKCVPSESKTAYDEFQKDMEEVKTITDEKLTEALGEPIKITIEPKVCKYCGAKNSSEWKYLPLTNEWCCKRRACRNKVREE